MMRLVYTSDLDDDVSICDMKSSTVDREALISDTVMKLCRIYDTVIRSYGRILLSEVCKKLSIDLVEYKRRSISLSTHLPKPYEMRIMNTIPGIWSDLFNTEVSMLCNRLLLDTNIELGNIMRIWALKMSRRESKVHLYNIPIMVEIQHGESRFDAGNSDDDETCRSVFDDSYPTSDEYKILKIINGMIVFNERLSDVMSEPREYYENVTSRLYYISEEHLLHREEVIKKERGKVLEFLKQLSKKFDIDKCTHNLAILYFDSYINKCLESKSLNADELNYNIFLRIGTAAYLLAAALREHWIDASRDSYLLHAISMAKDAFIADEIIFTQLDILQSMPKGFTNTYVAMEYGLFYLANIRGNDLHDEPADDGSLISRNIGYGNGNPSRMVAPIQHNADHLGDNSANVGQLPLHGASSNYFPVNGKATPGDRGGSVVSTGPRVEPVADLREAKGEVNRRSCLQDDLRWRADGRTTSCGNDIKRDNKPGGLLITDTNKINLADGTQYTLPRTSKNYKSLITRHQPGGTKYINLEGSNDIGPQVDTSSGIPVADLREAEGQLNRRADGRTISGGEWKNMTTTGKTDGSSVGHSGVFYPHNPTIPVSDMEDGYDIVDESIFDDYLMLNTAYRFLIDNGGFAWVYHCLSKWDDFYVARNWNRFIPPSRVAAVLIFHFFVEFYGINHEIHLIWCRRFCFKVFRMYFDTDLALWYKVFRENIKRFLNCIEKSSQRLHEIATLFQISAYKFRSAEATCYAFWTKTIINLLDNINNIHTIELNDTKQHLQHLVNIVVD